ncbi:hypothetical protein Z517_03557 [Fonsecaea pedrosoi CBS 271.37]|uniref:BZIP domain-containing protein n=1 Tax=Fonsecaea pedrosoi CBS 271.37 TaxID=1442368 RepID=A0A0D2FCF2_9EURO|nr:uncharacterized protein Z517_03557 [Fonsecaea pedrosoi CBS 271.37]KIW84307.1 hypothetical protein Z517_03557 [Fonsecaea pedrosoi CBS 271.37]
MGDSENYVKKRRAKVQQNGGGQDSKKLRNRLSQQAFRERQAIYVKELEKRLQESQKPETCRMATLEEENRALRDQLLVCRKKLRNIQASLESVSVGITGALYDKDPFTTHCSLSGSEGEQPEPDAGMEGEMDRSAEDLSDPRELSISCDTREYDGAFKGPSEDTMLPQSDTLIADIGLPNIPARGEGSVGQLEAAPILCSELLAELNSLEVLESSFQRTNMANQLCAPTDFPFNSAGILFGTDSLFSAHIMAFESCITRRWDEMKHELHNNLDSLRSVVDLMLSTFVGAVWPSMTSFYAYTGGHIQLGRLIMWRVDSNPETYANLHQAYRPTLLQLSSLHAAIIDWIPFPSLRDRIIQAYNNEHLDRLIGDIGDSYVLQVDLSKLVQGFSTKLGFVGLWDLVTVATSEHASRDALPFPPSLSAINTRACPEIDRAWQSINNNTKDYRLPAPSLEALFTSPEYALAAIRSFNLKSDPSSVRIDPTFFQKYPELQESQSALIARGTPLRRPDRPCFPLPTTMTTMMMQKYHNVATWAFESALEKLRN